MTHEDRQTVIDAQREMDRANFWASACFGLAAAIGFAVCFAVLLLLFGI